MTKSKSTSLLALLLIANGPVRRAVLCFMSALISEVATASRQLWSFARDGVLPFSELLGPVRWVHVHTYRRVSC